MLIIRLYICFQDKFLISSIQACSERSWPWLTDKILPVILWLAVIQSELELSVTWQVSVVRVVDVFGNSEHQRIVELIEFVVREFDIVLNAISVEISNSSFPCFLCLGSLQEFEILWALDIFDIES